MTSLDSVKDQFDDGIDNFTDEFHDVIKEAAKNCDPDTLETLVSFLDGDVEWQGSVLRALSGKCAKELNEEQLEAVGKFLFNENPGTRINATGVLGWNGTWPNEKLFQALIGEQHEGVRRSMLATALGLAGVPDRQSVKLAMQTTAAGQPITRELVEGLIAEHARQA